MNLQYFDSLYSNNMVKPIRLPVLIFPAFQPEWGLSILAEDMETI